MASLCEALPGVAYPGVRDNRITLNTKTGYDDDDEYMGLSLFTSTQRAPVKLYRVQRCVTVIQDHRHLCQSKAHTRLLISLRLPL